MTHEVLIIGGNHQNPLGVIESLAQKGIRSNVIIYSNCKHSFVLRSKFIKRSWICATDEDVLNCLRTNFAQLPEKTIAYACCDDMASLLNNHYNELNDFLILPGIPEQGLLTSWMDKEKMTELAASLGLNIPRTWVVSKDAIPSDLEYPCVTKSMSSVKNGKSEFHLCNNFEELESFLAAKAHSTTIQVQQYIDKEFEFQYLGCSLNGGEQIIIPGRTHIEDANDFNNITFLKYQQSKVVESATTLQKTEEFVKTTGYSGLFSVEFMHGKDGKDYFLEMNFRNDGNGIVVTAAGTNLPYIWYLYHTGGDYQKELDASTVKDTYSCPEDSYFIAMLDGKMSFSTWYRNFKKVTCYITYFKGDTGPFWALMWLMKRSIFVSTCYCFLRKLHLMK